MDKQSVAIYLGKLLILVIVVGGDGSLLHAARALGRDITHL